ncbi:MAG: enoyl-CoA hydratase-related protein [Nitrospira sp.]|nr:enoyl-CoA hydratase-related protein [Nitrospira sp.]MCP9461320.1 enoyl-CoA hydratase-related protein [Nitrospira sp.]MCP9474159.1 enoyl-CoA hydratase-related protein [Nitrospira sp.]
MKQQRTILIDPLDPNGKLLRVTLNRPERRNAFDHLMVDELYQAFVEIGKTRSVYGVILTGAGPVFCAGADLHWMGSETVTMVEARRDAESLLELLRTIDACPCPVIGRIQGPAFGGGIGLIAACDIVIARADATLAFGEVRVGLVPAVIAPFVLRKTGSSFLRRYGLTGEPFSASLAKEVGLVHEVVEPSELDDRVDHVAELINCSAPGAARETKALLQKLGTLSEDEQWKLAVETNVRARLSSEAREGMRAFREKRKPLWPGTITV